MGVEFAHIERCQSRTAIEHVAHAGYVLGVEFAHIERCQCIANTEHGAHVGDVLGVEVAHIERCQCRAAIEHVAHVGDVLGIEFAHIERCQCRAAIEHVAHVGDLFGVKIPYAFNVLQNDARIEPTAGAGGAVPGKGGIEHDVLNIFLGDTIITCPSGKYSRFGHVVDMLIISTGGAQIVIIKSERLVGC